MLVLALVLAGSGCGGDADPTAVLDIEGAVPLTYVLADSLSTGDLRGWFWVEASKISG